MSSVILRNDFLFVFGGSNGAATGLCCYLPTNSWVQIRNPNPYATTSSGNDSYFLHGPAGGTFDSSRLCRMASMVNGSIVGTDGDGTAIATTLETRALGGLAGMKAFGDAFLSYAMADNSSADPTLAVSRAPGIQAITYTAVPESPLAETALGANIAIETRKRFSLNTRSQTVSIKVVQTIASSGTEIYGIEYQMRPLGPVASGS